MKNDAVNKRVSADSSKMDKLISSNSSSLMEKLAAKYPSYDDLEKGFFGELERGKTSLLDKLLTGSASSTEDGEVEHE